MVKSFDALGVHTGSDQERMNLWLRCNAKLEEYHVEPSTAIQFFEVCTLMCTRFCISSQGLL